MNRRRIYLSFLDGLSRAHCGLKRVREGRGMGGLGNLRLNFFGNILLFVYKFDKSLIYSLVFIWDGVHFRGEENKIFCCIFFILMKRLLIFNFHSLSVFLSFLMQKVPTLLFFSPFYHFLFAKFFFPSSPFCFFFFLFHYIISIAILSIHIEM